MTRVVTTLAVLVSLALPSTSAGQATQTNAPPGNSAVQEYLETVPGASGDRSSSAGGGSKSPALTAAQRARLERLGPDGKALADAVDATSPARTATPGSTPTAGRGRSPLSEVFEVATGDGGGGGMGALLPAILLASLLGVVALALMRRRSAHRT
jgi:hypothetical protein